MIPWLIDSFRGGISDEHTRGVKGSFKFGYGLDIHKRRDSLSCLYAMQSISSTGTGAGSVTDLIRFAVTAQDGSTYAFGDTGNVYGITGSSTDADIHLKYADANGATKGALEWKTSDITNTNTYLFWTTGTSIARKLLPGNDAWSDVSNDYKTTLDSGSWHVMRNAAGRVMIGNNNFLASIDYDGNFDPAAMNIRPGNLIKTLEERDDYVILGSTRVDNAEEGHIWNWVTTATNWLNKKKIPVKGINALIDTELLLLQGGTNGEIFYSDFANTAPLNSVPDGGYVDPDGVAIYQDLAMFGFFGGTSNPGVYSYGRRMKNRPFALNYDYRMSKTVLGSTVSEIGSTWTVNGTFFASWKTTDGSTSEYGVDMVSSTTRAVARYESLEFTGGQPHLKKAWETQKVIMEPLPTGCSVNVLFKTSRATTGGDSSAGAGWKYARIADGSSTTYSVVGSTEAEFIIADKAKVFELGIELTPSGTSTPEITALVGYFGDKPDVH